MGSMSHMRQESPGFSRGEEFKVNPRLHYRQYPRVRGYIRDSCNRCRSAVEQLTQLVDMQDELNDIECYANGELDFGGDF